MNLVMFAVEQITLKIARFAMQGFSNKFFWLEMEVAIR